MEKLMWGSPRDQVVQGQGLWKQLDPGYRFIKSKPSPIKSFFDIIREWVSQQPKKTYEQELRRKLDRVREQIIYTSTWRRPTLEECKAGMEIEMMSSYGYFKGHYPTIFNQETHMNLFGQHLTNEQKYQRATLRIRIK